MSVPSQATGAETDAADTAAEAAKDASSRKRKRQRVPSTVVAELEHARWRHFGWMVFGLLVGALFVIALGLVGKGIGLVLLIIAAINGRNFARTLLNEAGEIKVGTESLRVPLGLCHGETREYPFAKVKHAFFLRRAVPWTRAGPVLVIEAGDDAFSYPRDWFSSDSDQKRVVAAINRRLGRG